MSKLQLAKIKTNKEKIVKLLNENIDLHYQLEVSKFTRFSEKTINIGTKKIPNEVKAKVGHWFEFFYDEDFPNNKKKAVKIERKILCEIDGKKSDHWNILKYYTISDV